MKRTNEIAIIISDFKGALTEQFVKGIQNIANRCGFATTTFSMLQKSDLFTNNEECVYNLIDYNRYDGIIIVTRSFTHKELCNRLSAKIKASCTVPVISIGDSMTFPSVATRNSSKITEDLIDHLMDVHMCKKILILGGERGMKSSKIDGIYRAFEKHSVKAIDNLFLYGGYWTECAQELATSIADQKISKPDAVVCISDAVANALIQKLYHYGFRVPEDILIASCDSYSSGKSSVLSLTTIDSDPTYLGEAAFANLYELITGHGLQLRERENSLILGMSCGCGSLKQGNIRLRLEKEERRRKAAMEYRNSKLEEKLYTIKTFSEFPYYIRNLSYLILDSEMLGLSLVDSDYKTANCLFLSNYLENGEKVPFPASDLFPKQFNDRANLNTNVLPLIFNEVMYGFVTIASHTSCIYGEMTKDFVHKVSIALSLMKDRGLLAQTEKTSSSKAPSADVSSRQPVSTALPADSAGTIFALKNDVLYKVSINSALYFECRDKKTFIILMSGAYPVKKRLFEIEENYRDKGFLRISKSVIVNMSKVVQVSMCEDRTILATLSNKEKVRVSRQYVKEFKDNLSL